MAGEAESLRLPALLDSAPMGVFATDSQGECIWVNAFWEQFLGHPREVCLGRGWMDCVHPDDRDRAAETWFAAVRTGAPFESDHRFVRRDGEAVWVLARAVPRLENGEIVGYVGHIADITHIRAAEEERARLLTRLHDARRLESVGTLAGGIAHDFNNLLTAIRGALQMALICGDEDSRETPYLRAAEEASERAAELTRQLLTLGRRTEPDPQPTDINRAIDRTIRLLRHSVPDSVDLETRLDPELPLVQVDPTHLAQILLNLGMNARDAMPDGGRAMYVTERQSIDDASSSRFGVPVGEYVAIVVSDTGTGIAPDVLPHVFEPFFTTKEAREGNGLGLPMVRSCAVENGGGVTIDSVPDQGTSVRVLLPLREAHEGPSSRVELPSGRETVLLVDDEELVLFQAGAILERCGYTILSARSASEALDLLEKHGSDVALVLTDLVMPGAGGSELLRLIRAEGVRAPVVLMSGFTEPGKRKDLLREGFADFVAKPFDAGVLARSVRSAIDGTRPTPAGRSAGADS